MPETTRQTNKQTNKLLYIFAVEEKRVMHSYGYLSEMRASYNDRGEFYFHCTIFSPYQK